MGVSIKVVVKIEVAAGRPCAVILPVFALVQIQLNALKILGVLRRAFPVTTSAVRQKMGCGCHVVMVLRLSTTAPKLWLHPWDCLPHLRLDQTHPHPMSAVSQPRWPVDARTLVKKKCESSGCCFEKVKHSKDPWCFKPVAAPGPSTCSVSSEHKENCGYRGVHQSGCEDRGCCWETVRGDPSCFRPRPDPAQCSENPACVAAGLPGHNFCCPAEDGMRLACCDGAPTLHNSTQVVVASVGLLAKSASGSNPSTSNECSVSTKVACGRAHTGQKKCESSGCCFEKVKHSKDPWCFKPVAAPGPSTCSVSSEHKENCGYRGVHQSGCDG